MGSQQAAPGNCPACALQPSVSNGSGAERQRMMVDLLAASGSRLLQTDRTAALVERLPSRGPGPADIRLVVQLDPGSANSC